MELTMTTKTSLAFDIAPRPQRRSKTGSYPHRWGDITAQIIALLSLPKVEGEEPAIRIKTKNIEEVRKIANSARTAVPRLMEKVRPGLRLNTQIDTTTHELFLWAEPK